MNYDHILIRYGELGLKGKNQKQFIIQLQQNIKNAIRPFTNARITRTYGRMYVVLNGEEPEPIIEELKKVFGIYSLSLAIKAENDEASIKEAALRALQKEKNAKTFKVSVRRANKQFPIGSQEMNQILGAHLLKNTTGFTVDVHHPDVEIRVEIRERATYITSTIIPGAGGLPVGTGGKALLLLSGGIDSPVAGYHVMKRGVQLEMIHFHSPPFTSERAKQKVLDVTRVLTKYGGSIKVHLVPFTKLQQEIFKQTPERYGMTIMRRMMLRISEAVCERNDILAMVTGESVGQVASQTLASLHSINDVTNMPVLRPLISFDKEQIIEHAKEIGTYDISIRPYEDCCTIFVPKSPVTNPKRDKVRLVESEFHYEPLLQETIDGIETITIEQEEKDDDFADLL